MPPVLSGVRGEFGKVINKQQFVSQHPFPIQGNIISGGMFAALAG
jgi:hypothetical protein